MKAPATTTTPWAPVPYYRLLSLRGHLEEIDAALGHPSQPGRIGRRAQLPPLALRALRKVLAAELETAEAEWRTPRRPLHKRAA